MGHLDGNAGPTSRNLPGAQQYPAVEYLAKKAKVWGRKGP